MPVVPITQARIKPKGLPDVPPPSEPFALMAAAQINQEGRLFKPTAPDIYETRPQASLGGRSPVEANNPDLGPTPEELQSRVNQFRSENEKRSK